MDPEIGELKIEESGKVFAWLDGLHGIKWYCIGNMNSDVINNCDYVMGKVNDFPLEDLYADSKTAAIVLFTK